ncbi:ribosome biogenesis GTPase Der [Candidatus Nomurabacteria bacterium]|nr:ribosome biogenesis GTPase Der [Candidatus Nomurabacteria bacterium]
MATPAHLHDDQLPTIALVGRVNVGKSTLFNTLTEDHKAIVSTIAGTTRTNNEGMIIWRGEHMKLIDTGGLTFDENIPLEKDIIAQSTRAIEIADVIFFVTDAQVGILPQELELAKILRKQDKPIFLLANKADTEKKDTNIYTGDWQKLGLGEVIPISAANGRNLGDLLDTVYNLFQSSDKKPKLIDHGDEPIINIALIGKPNVGKSSLFNQIIGEDKVIVSEMAHTTREPHDTLIEYTYEQEIENEEGDTTVQQVTQKINFIDTAGIRRKSRVSGFLERVGIRKSIDAIEKSDIILFVIDASDPIAMQDMQLGGLIEKRSKSVMILVNKWDLIEDHSQTNQNNFKKIVYSYFPHLDFAPILFTSGKTGLKAHQVFPEIIHVWNARHTKIANRGLEQFLEEVTKKHKPSRGKGTRHPKLLGMTQVKAAPPIFELFVKYRTSLHRSYLHFIENQLREHFDFTGAPIVIKLRKIKR